jgi:hypothetical protein
MGTSTGIALPRTSIGNLRVWVPTYTLKLAGHLENSNSKQKRRKFQIISKSTGK